jgi:hypothetical protein
MVLNRLASDSESSDDEAQTTTATAALKGFTTIRNVASVLKTSTVQQKPKHDSQRSQSSRYPASVDAKEDEDDFGSRASQFSAPARTSGLAASSAADAKRSSKRSSQRSLISLDSDSETDDDGACSSTALPTAASSQHNSTAAAAAASAAAAAASAAAAAASSNTAVGSTANGGTPAAAAAAAAGSAEEQEHEELDITVHNVSATPDGVELMPFQQELRHLGRYQPLQLAGGAQLNAAAARYLMPHQREALHFAWSLLQTRKGGILVSHLHT